MNKELAEKIIDTLIDLSCVCPETVFIECAKDCDEIEAKKCWITELVKIEDETTDKGDKS